MSQGVFRQRWRRPRKARFIPSAGVAAAAFPTGWTRKCELTISSDNVDSNLTNFPVLLTEGSLPSEMLDANGSFGAQHGGGDIRFSSDSSGTNQLSCEVVRFVTDNTPANGEAIIFVNVPTLNSTGGTSIWVWYKGPADSTQPFPTQSFGRNATWNSDFVGVWHAQPIMADHFEQVDFLGGYEGSNPVVALGTGGDTDLKIREIGNVVWDSNTNQYLMVYTGYNAGVGTDEYIHGATSPDGKTWTKTTTKPLIDARRNEDPYLVIDGTTYYIFCEDKTGAADEIRCYSNNTFDEDWDTGGTDHGVVFAPAASGWDSLGTASPTVWKEGSTWYMLYEGWDELTVQEIGLATSSSPTSGWTREPTNPVFEPSEAAWVGNWFAPDDIYKDADNLYHMTYHGENGVSGPVQCGFATATDLKSWSDSSRNPVLTDLDTPGSSEYAVTWQVTVVAEGFYHYYYRSGDDSGIFLGYGHMETLKAPDAKGANPGTHAGTFARADLFATGKFGFATDFDGATNNFNIPHDTSLDISSLVTIAAWVQGDDDPEDINANQYTVAKGDLNYGLLWSHSTGTREKSFTYAPDYPTGVQDTTDLTTGTWYYFTGRRGASNDNFDRDGTNRTAQARATNIDTNTSPFRIGAGSAATPESFFDGRVQEVRLSNVDRGIDWHKAEYFNMNAPGTFTTAGTPETVGAFEIEAEPGSFTITGIAATLLHNRIINAEVGTFALTGAAATLLYHRLLNAEVGTFALTGTNATLLHHHTVNAEAASFLITGQDASLLLGHIINAEPASFAVTGNDAFFVYDRALNAETGTFALTGIDASLLYHRLINAETGGYVLTGVNASLLHGRSLNAESGAFVLAGVNNSLLHHRVINAEPGSIVLTGVSATLVWSGEGAFTLICDPGSFAITGAAATLLHHHAVNAEPASFALTGVDATLLHQRVINAETGSFAVTGAAAELLSHRILNAEPGSIILTGIDATLVYTPLGAFELICDPGTFTITGVAATLLAQRLITASPGSFSITGAAAELQFTRTLNAEPGSYLLTGLPLTMLAHRLINAEPGSYAITEADAILLAARKLVAEVGSFVWTGAEAQVLRHALMNASPGTFTVTGTAAQLVYSAVNLPNAIFFTSETLVVGTTTSETLSVPSFTDEDLEA